MLLSLIEFFTINIRTSLDRPDVTLHFWCTSPIAASFIIIIMNFKIRLSIGVCVTVIVPGDIDRLLMVSLPDHILVSLFKEVVDFIIKLFSVTMITNLFLVFLVDDIGPSVTSMTDLLSSMTLLALFGNDGNLFTSSFITVGAIASTSLSICLSPLFLFIFHLDHTIMLDSLNFLPHSKEFNHLFCLDSSCDELSNRHFILCVEGCVHVVVTVYL